MYPAEPLPNDTEKYRTTALLESAGESLPRLFLPWMFNCRLKGALVILITRIHHAPSPGDNVAISSSERGVPAGRRV